MPPSVIGKYVEQEAAHFLTVREDRECPYRKWRSQEGTKGKKASQQCRLAESQSAEIGIDEEKGVRSGDIAC